MIFCLIELHCFQVVQVNFLLDVFAAWIRLFYFWPVIACWAHACLSRKQHDVIMIQRLTINSFQDQLSVINLVCSSLSRNSHALEGSCLSTHHGHHGDMKPV